MERAPDDNLPNMVDKHVGERIRRRRRALGISQDKLAESLGLTFQQVQKYERGANRVSASKLYQISKTLQASVAYFFEGLPDPRTAGGGAGVREEGQPAFVHDLPLTPEEREVVDGLSRIESRKLKRPIVDLIKALADESAKANAPVD